MTITIEDETFVDGTFEAGNIIYGSTEAPSGADGAVRSVVVTFGSDGVDNFTAGTGDVHVFVTPYSSSLANRTSSSGIVNLSVSDVSSTGFTINVQRSGTSITNVYWMAIRSP